MLVRPAALLSLPILIGATAMHAGNGWLFSAPQGGWEFPAFLTAAMLVQAGLGAGAHALDVSRLLGRAPATRWEGSGGRPPGPSAFLGCMAGA